MQRSLCQVSSQERGSSHKLGYSHVDLGGSQPPRWPLGCRQATTFASQFHVLVCCLSHWTSEASGVSCKWQCGFWGEVTWHCSFYLVLSWIIHSGKAAVLLGGYSEQPMKGFMWRGTKASWQESAPTCQPCEGATLGTGPPALVRPPYD